jgi:hypothetical protein
MSLATFRRHLSEPLVGLLLSHSAGTEILRITKRDPELQAQLRGSSLDVYYQGYIMFRVGNGGSLQVGSIHDGWTEVPTNLDGLSPSDVPKWIARVKDARRQQYRPGSENSFESKFLRDNERPPSGVLPLDRQIVHPREGLLRVDALLYDLTGEQLVLAELKVHDNPEIRTKVFGQLEGYRSLFERKTSIKSEYERVFEQKKRLGLVEHPLERINTAAPPGLLLVVAGHPDSKYGTNMSPRAIENALDMKRRRWPHLSVRIAYWPDFQQNNLMLAGPVSELPTFEAWAEEMLL